MSLTLRHKTMLGILLVEAALLALFLWMGSAESGFSAAEIAAAPRDILIQGLLLGGGLLVLTALLSVLHGNHLARAIERLKQGAAALAAGHDELSEVAQVFNSMSRRLAELASEQERTRHQLVQLADQDPLTGLMNRRRFHAELDRRAQHALRYQRPLSLLFILKTAIESCVSAQQIECT